MKCSNCGNEFEGNFCPQCGVPAERVALIHHTCPKCGNEYDGNFCPACGTPASGSNTSFGPTPMSAFAPSRPKKKHGCLIAVLAIIGFFLFVGIISSILGTASPDTTASSPVTSTEAPSETAANESTPIPTEGSTSAIDSSTTSVADSNAESGNLSLSMEEIGPLLDSIISQNFDEDKYTLEYDDTGITLSLWEDGLAVGAALAASGNADAKTAWDDMVDNIIYMSNSITDALETMGIENTVITINILNEENTDNTLLCVMNGVVIYDATKE